MIDSGLVYFVLDATRLGQRLKIGTTTNLRERLAALRKQTVSGQEPLLLALQEGGQRLERSLHEQYARWRLDGEWFTYDATEGPGSDVARLEQPDAFLYDRPHLWWYARGWRGVPDTTQPPGVRDVEVAAVLGPYAVNF